MKRGLACILCTLCLYNASFADPIFTEDFTGAHPNYDNPGVITFSSSGSTTLPFSTGLNDHYRRTDGSDISLVTGGSYTGASNTFFFASEDNGASGEIATMLFTGIDITSAVDVTSITGLFAAEDFVAGAAGSGRYDTADFMILEYQIDGGGFLTAIEFQDTALGDMENVADNTELTNTFSMHTFVIPGTSVTGTTMDLRIRLSGTSSHEGYAFDNIVVNATIPEPSAFLLLGFVAIPAIVVKKRGWKFWKR